MAGGKACPNSQVLSFFLKTPREGARRISTGKLFQRRGATAEKALLLVLSFRTYLSVGSLRRPAWLEQVTLAELGDIEVLNHLGLYMQL